MPSTEARVRTDRAGRYLAQLCRHTARITDLDHPNHHASGSAATRPRRTEFDDTDGVIEFDAGRCTVQATGDELILLARADDVRSLRLIQAAIAARLEQIGGRDQLSVTWQPRSGDAP